MTRQTHFVAGGAYLINTIRLRWLHQRHCLKKQKPSDQPLSVLPMRAKRLIPTSTKLVIFATAVALMTAGCRSCADNGSPQRNDDSATVRSEPSREHIIEAVRRSVDGKKYEETVYRREQVTRICSQQDVDLDPYMPRNPELAKCPRAGARYTTWENVPRRETRECASLPGTESGWNVQEVARNRWRVSLGGSVWDVENKEGAAVEQGVKVSTFLFAITPHQKC
jgi:hypothetical protein